MKKPVSFLLVAAVLLSFSLTHYADAKGKEKDIEFDEEIAIDCNFLYNLDETTLEKYSLPDLTLVSSVDLPSRTEGEEIVLAGGCSDPLQTILVAAKRKGRDGGKLVLSYNTDLQLIAEKKIEDLDDDDDDDDDDNDDDDHDNDDDD